MRSSKPFNEDGKRCGTSGMKKNATNREALVEWQEKRLREKNQMYLDELIPKYFCPPRSGVGNHCRVALYDVYEADINCLVVFKNIRLREKYFIGRTITHSLYQFSVVSVVVENWEGTQALWVYIVQRGSDPMFVPAGLVIIVTQPMVRQMYNGNHVLWCTDPSDIHFLDELGCKRLFPHLDWKRPIPAQFEHTKNKPHTTKFSTLMFYGDCKKDPLDKLIDQILNEGNEFFLAKKYTNALESYQRAHEIAGNDVNILANRSMALYKLRCFSLAYEDAGHALKFEPLFIKAILSKSRAMSAMNRFQHTLEFLKSYAGAFENTNLRKIAMTELNIEELRVTKMMKNHTTGVYPMKYIVSTKVEKLEDYGEYLGPLQIKEYPGKGRGVIATKKIKAGELVLATRGYELISFASVLQQQPKEKGQTMESLRQQFFATSTERLSVAIMKHLAAEPHTKKDVLSLYAGPELGFLKRDDVKRESEVDLHRIMKIVHYNAFTYQCSGGEVSGTKIDRPNGMGLWVQPSLINHSCVDGNCCWKIYGDFIFVRAFKDIEIGEELLMPYFSPAKNYLSRKLGLENLGINCDCQLCKIEKTIPKSDLLKKLEIMERHRRYKPNAERNCRTHQLIIRRDMEAIKKMYNNPSYNFDLMYLRRESSNNLIFHGITNKAMEELKLAHSVATGTCHCDYAATVAASMVWLLLNLKGDSINAQKWVDILQNDLTMAYGTADIMECSDLTDFYATFQEMKSNNVLFREPLV